MRFIEFPALDNRRERFLSVGEAQSLLVELANRSPDVHDMALLFIHCGLRLGEICRLRWEDVALDRMSLVVWVTERAGKGGTRARISPRPRPQCSGIAALLHGAGVFL